MLRRLTLSLGVAGLALSMTAAVALAGNPSGTGQPSQECDDFTVEPGGFSADGFAVAEDLYANDGSTGGIASQNGHVVSQYDVACYQISIH